MVHGTPIFVHLLNLCYCLSSSLSHLLYLVTPELTYLIGYGPKCSINYTKRLTLKQTYQNDINYFHLF